MIDFKALSGAQKWTLAVFVAAIVGAAGYFIYAVVNPAQVEIFHDSSLEQVGKVTAQLDEQGIEYQLDAEGTGVMVDEAQASRIKIKLAAANAADAPSAGFELFDNVDYSMTEKAQKITYQRALQGELERTLNSYTEVEQARVHIMIPERKLFSIQQAKAKASVSLVLNPGFQLNEAQVNGIQALVAASVEGLNERDVIVLNGEGIKISDNQTAEQGVGSPQSSGQFKLEQQLTEKALNLLGLYFDRSQVAVSVSVSVNRTQTKEVKKALIGDSEERGFVTRKKESVSYRKPTKDDPKPSPNKEFETEYNHGSEVTETLYYAGAISQLNVAIAVVADIDEPQLEKLRKLVAAGLGVDASRGDKLSVESFKPVVAPHQPENTEQQVVAAKQPKLIVDPQQQNSGLTMVQKLLGAAALLVLLLSVLVLTLGSRRKSLSLEQKQAQLVQFNEWINQAKVEQNAG